jgi:hypothetical protein
VVEREPDDMVLVRHWTSDERRGIDKPVESERSLQNRDVQKINPRLQVRTPVIVCHDVECTRVKKCEEKSENVM